MTEDVTSETEQKTTIETIRLDPGTARAIKISVAIIAVVLCAMAIIVPLADSYNALVDSNLQVTRAASNVKTDLERRADLLPNLAATIQGSATFEYKTQHDTFVQVAEARALASAQARAQIEKSDPVTIAATGIPQESQVTQLLGNFVKLQEAYPDLKLETTQQFREFEAQTTATENEILVDRQTYNAAVTQYQRICRSFPTVIVAKWYGFDPDKYSMYIPANQTRAETVPAITFDFSNL